MTWGDSWPFWYWFLVDMFAAYRITRLVTKDAVTAGFRKWLAGYEGPLVELFFCHWCIGFWISAAVVVLTWAWPLWWGFAALAFALSATVGWLADRQA